MKTAEMVAELSVGLLNALEQCDRSTPPYGLYASDDLVVPEAKTHYYQEWYRGIKPYLESQGARLTDSYSRPPIIRFYVPDIGNAQLNILTISKIKVRKYGSRYHLDKHESYDQRWVERNIGKNISVLWKQPGAYGKKLRFVVFLGYDKALQPFERELKRLQIKSNWEKHEVQYFTREWQDIYGRGFGIRVSIWVKYSAEGVASR